MKLLNYLFFSIVILVLSMDTTSAQKVSFDDVVKVKLNNSGTIIENQRVVGYYYFYFLDKKDAKNNLYLLNVVDENLGEVFSKQIAQSRTKVLLDVVYNGNAFLLSFVDTRERKMSFVTYDANGERLGGRTLDVDENSWTQFNQAALGEAGTNTTIFPAGEDGFFFYLAEKRSKFGYSMYYFPNDFDRDKDWKKGSKQKAESHEFLSCIGTDDKFVYNILSKQKKLTSTKGVQSLFQVVDHRTGDKLFEKSLYAEGAGLFPINTFYLESKEQFLVFGIYSAPTENASTGVSDGIMCVVYDKEGEVVKSQKYSWSNYFREVLEKDKNGNIKPDGSIFLHKIVQTANGHIYGIGEYYRKAADAVGFASQILTGGGGGSATKLLVKDLVIMELDEALELVKIKLIDKPKSDIELPRGIGASAPLTIAFYVKAFGGFDYAYTQLLQDNSTFTTAYEVREKGDKKKKETFLNFVSHTMGGDVFIKDKLSLSTDATWISYYPAKPGYVMITEYFRKGKALIFALREN